MQATTVSSLEVVGFTVRFNVTIESQPFAAIKVSV